MADMRADTKTQNPVNILGKTLGEGDTWLALQQLLKYLDVPDLFPKNAKNATPSSIATVATRGDVLVVSWRNEEIEDKAAHYGLYVGLDKNGVGQVVHMMKQGNIKKDSLDEFMDLFNTSGRVVRRLGVLYYESDTEQAREYAAQLAETLVNLEKSHQPVYNLLFFNCEIFALWCRTPWRYNTCHATSVFKTLPELNLRPLTKLGWMCSGCTNLARCNRCGSMSLSL
jgi:hypothetical protein